MALPGPLAAVMGSGRATRLLRRLPGAAAAKAWLARRYGEGRDVSPFGLDDADERALRAFVERFYARDLALIPG